MIVHAPDVVATAVVAAAPLVTVGALATAPALAVVATARRCSTPRRSSAPAVASLLLAVAPLALTMVQCTHGSLTEGMFWGCVWVCSVSEACAALLLVGAASDPQNVSDDSTDDGCAEPGGASRAGLPSVTHR